MTILQHRVCSGLYQAVGADGAILGRVERGVDSLWHARDLFGHEPFQPFGTRGEAFVAVRILQEIRAQNVQRAVASALHGAGEGRADV